MENFRKAIKNLFKKQMKLCAGCKETHKNNKNKEKQNKNNVKFTVCFTNKTQKWRFPACKNRRKMKEDSR